jgi:hypothetical protein
VDAALSCAAFFRLYLYKELRPQGQQCQPVCTDFPVLQTLVLKFGWQLIFQTLVSSMISKVRQLALQRD